MMQFPSFLLVVAIATLLLLGTVNARVSDINTYAERNTTMEVTHKVFFDVLIDSDPIPNRIEIELFGNAAPKTVENFLEISKGHLMENGDFLSYQGTEFHRIIPGFMVQGGDLTKGKGGSQRSIFGGSFDDEPFVLNHEERGFVSMANAGENTNGSQFFITVARTHWLNGRHVVFGKVTEETMPAVEKLEALGTMDGLPTGKAVIFMSGELSV